MSIDAPATLHKEYVQTEGPYLLYSNDAVISFSQWQQWGSPPVGVCLKVITLSQ